ncbi:hypothetical protein [Agromyces sp. C10]|uniref:hypothetical protein n=1 Tax=Agromyces sp. C10 TaxID=2935077 RepID=UPI00200B684F|nr:hypothetical protein [Agromyces sp. C10]MCK8608547.1 hypothetical protein [Agromyces sp. C10]
MQTRALFAIAVGTVCLLLGLVLFYMTAGFQEVSMLSGHNLVVDGQLVDYVAPWPMYVIPSLLTVAGGALVLTPLIRADIERVPAG